MEFKSTQEITEAVEQGAWITELARSFWAKVEPNGDCWEWQGTRLGGYGRVHVGRLGHLMAHRVAYVLLVGPLPNDMPLDHLCRNRACCNPDHLEIVTPRQNTLRGATIPANHSRKTHCPKGHPYDDSNTLRTKKGGRACRECQRLRPKAVRLSTQDRFWLKVDKIEGGCWEWRGARKSTGYGNFCPLRLTTVLAHRYAWEVLRGPIPNKVRLVHTCGNNGCVNPDHLAPMKEREAARAAAPLAVVATAERMAA